MTEQAVPGYTELKTLGSGGFGRVVLARHDATGTMVAVKYLRTELTGDPEFATLFRGEAEVLGSLSHACVVRLYEYLEWPGGAAIAMELVDGATLRDMLRQYGKTSPEAALVVLYGSLLGLAEAHTRGVVHRDYKPENILVNEHGASKLTDFGIAARAGDRPVSAGSLAYAPPEQFDGTPASPASDVYAATATFYECLTGHPPFQGSTTEELIRQHRHASVPLTDVPVPLQPVVAAGMAKSPAYRPRDAAALAASLRTAATEAYGPDWERTGRSQLSEAALLLAALWPSAGAPAVSGFTLEQLQLARGHQPSTSVQPPAHTPSPATAQHEHLLHVRHLEHVKHLAHLRHLDGRGAPAAAGPRRASRAAARLRVTGAVVTAAAVIAAGTTVALTRHPDLAAAAASHPALSVYPVSLDTIPLTAASSAGTVNGDVYVLYNGGTSATAQLSGTIDNAPSGGTVRLYAQQFPFTSAPALASTQTLNSSGTASYSFSVTPTLATRYQVMLYGSASASTATAESAVTTVYVDGSFNSPTFSCSTAALCQATLNYTVYQPPSTLATEIPKQWYVYLAPDDGSGQKPQTLTLDTSAVDGSGQQTGPDEWTKSISISDNVGEGGRTPYLKVCFKDTEAQDGTGLPNASGCGDPVVPYSSYLG